MKRFAVALKRGLSVMSSEPTEIWSNEPVESFVHKLKLVKWQGYGRAGFDLLQVRVLAA